MDKSVQEWVTLTVDLSKEQMLSIARCSKKGKDHVAWEKQILKEHTYVEYITKAVQIAIGWHVENALYNTAPAIQRARYFCHTEGMPAIHQVSFANLG